MTNYVENDVWMKLRIYDSNGNILGKLRLIKPDEHIKSTALNECPSSGSPIMIKIMTYEPETYYSAGAMSLNTTIN